MKIYCIVENGTCYPAAYSTYAAAVAAVKENNKVLLQDEGPDSCSDIDVEECDSGITYLYIEKGISIYINRLPVLDSPPPSQLSYRDLAAKEASLQEKITTNYGHGACTIHPIHHEDMERTNGLVKNAIGKIVLRDMRVTKRHAYGRQDWLEHVDRVYIWANKMTTRIPEAYEDTIISWLAS